MRTERRGIGALLAAYLLLAVLYSAVVPLFESPDEIWHYEYIRWLAEGKGLAAPEDVGVAPWAQEGSQPPLYYLIGAAVTAPITTDNAAEAIRYNPHAAVGNADALGNKNMMLHGRAELWPWRGVALSAHVARLISVLLGAVTVALTYAVAKRVFPVWPAVAFLAAALVAFSPQFLFISASINNDNLVTALSTATLYLAIRILTYDRTPSPWSWLGLGALVGLAALSKLSGLLVAALVAATVTIAAWRCRSWRVFWTGAVLAAVAATAVAGWWYVRNWLLFGDPTLLNVMFAGVPPQAEPATFAELLAVVPGIWRSTWAVFGWFNVLADPWVYQVFTMLVLLAMAGWIVAALRQRATLWNSVRLVPLLMLVFWFVVIVVAVARWAQISYAQGRLLFPALAALATVMAGGLMAPWPAPWQRVSSVAVAIVLALLAAAAPFLWIRPAYPPPPLVPDGQAVTHTMDVRFDAGVRLIGAAVSRSEARPGDAIDIVLTWQADATPALDYSVFVHAVDAAGIVQAQHDSQPGLGSYPLTEWQPGDIVEDRHRLIVPAGAPAPSSLRIDAGLYDVESGQRVPNDQGDQVAIGEVAVLPPEDALPGATRINFDDKMALVGFALDRRTLNPGDTLRLTLWWEALAPMSQDYVVFAHLLLPPDAVWAQDDQMPQGGAARTSTWQVAQQVEDVYELDLPPDAPPGVYRIEVGVYDKDTFERLPVAFNDQGVVLAQVKVE